MATVDAYTTGRDREEFKFTMMQNIAEFLFDDRWHVKVKEFEHLDEKIVW